jgi:4-hydroxy-3-methylbut-2-enyl diphosphate reductase
MDRLADIGCHVVDTTCGDVMKVWRRVRDYAKNEVTSIIHGKAGHEETRATASRALGKDKNGHYLIILTLNDANYVCDYIRGNGNKEEFMEKFTNDHSDGFDPDLHLSRVGVANQTTMLQSETEALQEKIREAILDRDGNTESYHVFDTICGATQERQNALFTMLEKVEQKPMDVLLVVGGYNSSNTTHLAEIGEKNLPTFFIRNAKCIKSLETVVHYDIDHSKEIESSYQDILEKDKQVVIGVTAGASCPNNLIESTIIRIMELRGVDKASLEAIQ